MSFPRCLRPNKALPTTGRASALGAAVGLGLTTLPTLAEVPRVVTDIAPVHSLAAQVMGDLGSPELLVSTGSDPHSYQLRPSQAGALSNARLVFWIGPEMTPWLAHTLDLASAAEIVGFLDNPATKTRTYDGPNEDHGAGAWGVEGHEDGHEDEGHAGEDHAHSGTDPHAWLDPSNARAWIGLIRDRLAAADPGNAAAYQTNAARALADIDALEARIETELASARAHPILVGHDAYGYFADRFGLKIAGTIAAGDAAEPGAKHLSALQALAAAIPDLKCAFPEAGHNPAQLALVTEGTPIRIGDPLDPEGLTLEPGPGLYAAILEGLAETIARCDGG